jgi:SAM-dependent methyltransferase
MDLARRLGRRLPRPLRTAGVLALYSLQVLPKITGTYPRECPCCGYVGRFAMFGHPPRYDSRCPGCGSNERQRLIVLALERLQLCKQGDEALYFTPEPVLSDYLERKVGHFRSEDLKAPDRIDAPDDSFDLILASNILEHAPDEGKALAELRRVLRPDGHLIITVPMVGGWDATYENSLVQEEWERKLHFGESNHYRFYGRDIVERLQRADLNVDAQVATGDDSMRYALIRGDYVFLAQKQSTGRQTGRTNGVPHQRNVEDLSHERGIDI